MQEDNFSTEINDSLIFSVSEVTLHIKQVIETQIEALYIVGEISNFVRHSSGHIYFNLKDDNAVIRCVFFRNQNYQMNFDPEDGDQIICFGKISVFEKSGQYQVLVQNIFPYGRGELQKKFEQLKLKLKNEGLFEIEHKKPLPKFPEIIGVITSPTGAALQDILNVLERRYPCKVTVFPSLMQGKDAAPQVIKGLKFFNSHNMVDLIIISRGGGSPEDLFCFNDESLARAIHSSKIPVVSAIGHEIDFSISDFVSDLRAPTPSAAAELVVPDITEIESFLDSIFHNLTALTVNSLRLLQNKLHKLHLSIMQYNPERIWQSYEQRFDNAIIGLRRLDDYIIVLKSKLIYKQQLFHREVINQSRLIVQNKKHRIELARIHMSFILKDILLEIKHRLELASTHVDELSPTAVLERGYALVKKNGKIIKSVKSIEKDDMLELVISDGIVNVLVEPTRQE